LHLKHAFTEECYEPTLFFLSLGASLASALTGPDAVTRWNDHLLAVTAPDPPAPYRPNPEIAVVAAYMRIAMYDAISSIDGDYTPFVRPVTKVPPGASREAAVIEAAYSNGDLRVSAESAESAALPVRGARGTIHGVLHD
jgi:hypothetical protein